MGETLAQFIPQVSRDPRPLHRLPSVPEHGVFPDGGDHEQPCHIPPCRNRVPVRPFGMLSDNILYAGVCVQALLIESLCESIDRSGEYCDNQKNGQGGENQIFSPSEHTDYGPDHSPRGIPRPSTGKGLSNDHDETQENDEEGRDGILRKGLRCKDCPGCPREHHRKIYPVVPDLVREDLETPPAEIGSRRRVFERHPLDDLQREEQVDRQEGAQPPEETRSCAASIVEQDAGQDPLDRVDEVFAHERSHADRNRLDRDIQKREPWRRGEDSQEGHNDNDQIETQKDVDVPRHVPGQPLAPPARKPGKEDDGETCIPEIEPLNPHDRLGHIGVLHDGHEENQAAERLVPVLPGVDRKTQDEEADGCDSNHGSRRAPPTPPSIIRRNSSWPVMRVNRVFVTRYRRQRRRGSC